MESLIITPPAAATQTTRAVSAPGGHLPATGDVYDQCQDGGKKRGREEEEAIDGDQEKERVRSRGVELQPDPSYYGNNQATIPRIHQSRNGERNDLRYDLQDAQAEEHRDEVGILTGVKKGKGGNAEAENQAEEMEPFCRETQREESVDDQGSGKAQDVSNGLKPEISGMLAKDAHLRKEVERSDEEMGVMDVKTGEDKQSEKEGKPSTNYPEDNARKNVAENLRGTQEVRQDYDLKPVSEDKQRGGRIDDEEEKTEAGEKGIASEIGKQNHDYGRGGGSKQNMLKHDHQRREERMDAQEVAEQERGDGKQHAQSKDTSATERYPTEGVQAQDSDGVRRDDASVHFEQKIRIMPTIQEDVELDKKGKTEVHDRGMRSGTTKLLTIYDLLHSSENQDDKRVDDNKQKMLKDDQRWKEGGSSRHEGHEQEREGRRDVQGVTEQNRGDSQHPHFGQDVEDQSIDRQRMSEQKTSGTYPSHQGDGAETQSKPMQNRSDSSLRQAGSAGSSKPAECQGAGRGEKVRQSYSQLKPRLEFPESTREESPGSKGIEIKITDTEIRSETVAGTSSEGRLSKRFAKLKVSGSFPTTPKKRAIQKTVGNAQEEEARVTKKQKL